MTRSVRLALPGFLVMTFAGCVPDRDNRFDPASAPVGRVKVVGAPQGSPQCSSGAGRTQMPEFSRGWCLAVDASDSSDPQGSTTLTYSFSVIAPPSAARELGAGLSNPVLELDGPTRRAMLLDTALEIQVVVRDPGGATGAGTTTVVLHNEEPVAVVGPSTSLPEGGFPWALGEAFQTFFDGTKSFDADGDPLTYCWTFADGEVCSASPNDPAFTRPLPATREQHFGFLRVHDNPEIAIPPFRLVSRPAVATVSIREPNVWAVAEGTGSTLRLDSARGILYDLSDGARGAFMSRPSGDAVAVLYTAGAGPTAMLSTAPFPSAFPLSAPLPVSDDPAVLALAYDALDDVLWAITGPQNGCTGTLFRITLAGAPAIASQTPLDSVQCGAFAPILDVDEGGNVWIAEHLGPSLIRVPRGGGAATVENQQERIFTGVDSRPGSSEVWAVEMGDVLGGGGLSEDAVLRRYADFGSAEFVSYPLGVSTAVEVDWISESEFWISIPGQGLHLVDVELLDPTYASLEDATIAFAPVLDGLIVVADPVSGVAWASPGFDHANRVERNGDVTLMEASSIYPQLIDPEGALWFTGNQGLLRGFSPAVDGLVTTIDLFTFSGGEFDLLTGGAWVPTVLPPAIVRTAEDGTVIGTISQVDRNGVTELIPVPVYVRISPDGRTAYVAGLDFNSETGTGIDRIDLMETGPTGVPRITRILDAAYADDLEGTAGSFFEPSAPVTGSVPFLWVIRNEAAPLVATVSTAGTPIATRFTFPAAEVASQLVVKAARSLATNRLCVASVDDTNALIRMRSIPPTGTVVQLGTMPKPASMDLIGVAATDNPAMCWVAYNENNGANPIGHIRGWSTAGAPSRSHDEIDTYLESFYAESANRIWFTGRKENDQSNGMFKFRLGQWSAGTQTFQQRLELQPNKSARIFAPTSSQEKSF